MMSARTAERECHEEVPTRICLGRGWDTRTIQQLAHWNSCPAPDNMRASVEAGGLPRIFRAEYTCKPHFEKTHTMSTIESSLPSFVA
jgi:hypothetical protein